MAFITKVDFSRQVRQFPDTVALLSGSTEMLQYLTVGVSGTSGTTWFVVNGDSELRGDVIISGDLTVLGESTTLEVQTVVAEDKNITLNFGGDNSTSIGGGISIEDGTANGIDSFLIKVNASEWLLQPGLRVSGLTGYNQLSLLESFTPTGTTDPRGIVGAFSWDNATLHWKTPIGWQSVGAISLSGLSINDLGDVDTSTVPPNVGDVLTWDGSNFIPSPVSGASVTSVNGNTGVVVLDANDIGIDPITGLTAVNVQDALEELNNDINNIGVVAFSGGSGNCISDFYVENIHACITGITIHNDVTPPVDSTVNIGSPVRRFRSINTLSGTTTIWYSTTRVETPLVELGLDSSGNTRTITADTSILKDDTLCGGIY